MPLPRTEARTQTRIYVDDPTAPVVHCRPVDDETLRRIIRDSHALSLRVPGNTGRIDRAIRDFHDALLALSGLRQGRDSLPAGAEADVVRTFPVHRRAVKIRTNRHLLVGRLERETPGGRARTAILVFAHHKIGACIVQPSR